MPYLGTRIHYLRIEAENGDTDALLRYNTIRLQPPTDEQLESLDHGEDRYRYKFQPGPRQKDAVIRCILRTIKELNKGSIGLANMSFRVYPTNESPHFWLADSRLGNCWSKLYTFVDHLNEFPVTVWVAALPSAHGLTSDNLFLKPDNDWWSLKKWLLSQQTRPEELIGLKGYKAQKKWWKFTGKPFPLMKLPAEVRLIIFEHALGHKLYPLATRKPDTASEVRLGVGFHGRFDYCCQAARYQWLSTGGLEPIGFTSCAPNIALLQVCKQVHQEALQAAWENSLKCFFTPSQLESVVNAPIKPKYNWLNKIVLVFPTPKYFELFGCDPKTLRFDPNRSLGSIISSNSSLNSLKLVFRSPAEDFRSDDSSKYWCQRIAIDWIMTLAWPFINAISKVTIGGAIKRETKRKWDSNLAQLKDNKHFSVSENKTKAANFLSVATLTECSCRDRCIWEVRSEYARFDFDGDTFDYEDDL